MATARVRIFTPSFEMPFAGRPNLGAAHVVSKLGSAADAVTLEMRAGIIPVSRGGDTWTLCGQPPVSRQRDGSPRPANRRLLVFLCAPEGSASFLRRTHHAIQKVEPMTKRLLVGVILLSGGGMFACSGSGNGTIQGGGTGNR